MPFTVFFYCTYCNNRSLGKSLLSRNRNIKKKKKANISFYNDDFPATFKRMKTSLKILFQKIDLLSAQHFKACGFSQLPNLAFMLMFNFPFNFY